LIKVTLKLKRILKSARAADGSHGALDPKDLTELIAIYNKTVLQETHYQLVNTYNRHLLGDSNKRAQSIITLLNGSLAELYGQSHGASGHQVK